MKFNISLYGFIACYLHNEIYGQTVIVKCDFGLYLAEVHCQSQFMNKL